MERHRYSNSISTRPQVISLHTSNRIIVPHYVYRGCSTLKIKNDSCVVCTNTRYLNDFWIDKKYWHFFYFIGKRLATVKRVSNRYSIKPRRYIGLQHSRSKITPPYCIGSYSS